MFKLSSTYSQDDFIRHLIGAGIYFLAMVAYYINIGQDMGAEYFLPSLLPLIATLVAVQYGTGIALFSRAMLPAMVAGLFWCMTFPLLYTYTYSLPWYRSLIYFDFLIGTAFMVQLASAGGILFHLGYPRVLSWVLGIKVFVFSFIPLMQIAYYMTVWHAISPASLMAVYMTNWHETNDYIVSTVGYPLAACVIIALIFYIYWAYLGFRRFAHELYPVPTGGRIMALVAAFSIATAVEVTYLPQCSMAGLFNDVTSYVEQTQEYSAGHDSRYAELVVDKEKTLASRAPGAVIVVIGESASRNYMKVYTPNFIYEDTPWLSSKLGDEHFFIFQNTYSSWTQTVQTLERALTEKSQYNDKEFYDSASIIDVAKKAGYKTYWFSNQGRYGQFDSAITLVAKTADVAEWTDDSYTFTDKYDGVLLDFLRNVNPLENNFIVLHMMGSHIYYNNRYPSEFARFKSEDESSMTSLASYANSILYSDYILSAIFDYAQKNLRLQAMVYFSDHGENIEISHNPDVFSFDMVRIPFWIYVSDEYTANLPDRAAVLRSRRKEYFTNDMMYDTVSGLLNAPSNRYDPRQDFSSYAYDFQRDTLTTMLGQRSLLEDKTDEAAENAAAILQENKERK